MTALALNVLGFVAIALLYITMLGLALFALVMFVPVRYKCEGDIDGKKYSGSARVSWLFGFIALVLGRDQEITLRVMGIRVWRSVNNIENDGAGNEQPTAQENAGKEHTDDGKTDKKPRERQPKPKAERKKFTDSIKDAWHNFESFKNYPDKGEIFSQIVLLTKRVIQATLPERLDLRGSYGFEDPSYTGFATGAISALYPFVSPRIRLRLTPDFSCKILELKLLVRGKVSTISFVIPLCKFLFSKPVWKLIKSLLAQWYRTRRKAKATRKRTPSMQDA